MRDFICTTLEFIAQLQEVPRAVRMEKEAAMRRLAPRPETWITMVDLEHLRKFGIGTGFRLVTNTAPAAKSRLVRDLGYNKIADMNTASKEIQSDFWSRPFHEWHNRAYVTILYENYSQLRRDGVIKRAHEIADAEQSDVSQKLLQVAFVERNAAYQLEARIRQKTNRLHFLDPPAHTARRLVKVFAIFASNASPAVRASFRRALWNGWPTSARMRTCASSNGLTSCAFGCSRNAVDRLEHYAQCPMVWEFATAPVAQGMGIHQRNRSVDGCLCAKKIEEEEFIRMAMLVRVVAKTVMYCRKGLLTPEQHRITEVMRLERSMATKGTAASKRFSRQGPAAPRQAPGGSSETTLVSECRLRAADLL